MTRQASDFSREAGETRPSFARELWGFLRQNKKWWLGPLIVIVLVLSVLIILSSSAAAPFIYTLF